MPSERTWTAADLPPALTRAIELAVDTRARVPVVLRVAETGGYTDWALLLSGRSERNVRAIADAILSGLSKDGISPLGTDGLDEGKWALLDLDDFVVHVFYHPVREHYDLESMWSDAPRVKLELPDEVFDTSDLTNLDAPDEMPGFRAGFMPRAEGPDQDSGAATSGDTPWDMGEFGGFEDEFEDLGIAPGDDASAGAATETTKRQNSNPSPDSRASTDDELFDD